MKINRKPYQVLVDGTFCFAALKHKINIEDQITKYLEGEVKLLTTPCIVLEVEKLGPELFGVSLIIKKFPAHQCGHSKAPVSGSQCILDMISDNKTSRYIIATQDRELQDKCRLIKGIPLMYLHMKTPTLEPPSAVTQNIASDASNSKFGISKYDEKKLSVLENDSQKTPQEFPKKRKRKGGPNPLSCKKKKKTQEPEDNKKRKEKKKKRKRNRSILVKKIKKEIVAPVN